MEETKQKKIADLAINAYLLETLAAKLILLYLSMTMDSWPIWFRIGLSLTVGLSFSVKNTRGIILATILYLGVGNNILEKFPNDLPQWVRLAFMALFVSAAIFWIIYNKYHKPNPEPNPNLDKNSLAALMSDPRYNKGYFDPYVKVAEEK